jgi:hypothetical protein
VIDFCKSGKKPADIPSNPYNVYAEWVSWGDWLGTYKISNRKRTYRPFKEARAIVRRKGFKSTKDFRAWSASGKKAADIPSNPHRIYAKWVSWGDWLGSGNLGQMSWLPFEKARAQVRALGIRTGTEYRRRAGRLNLPVNPYKTYQNKGWVSWSDWLGSTRVGRGKCLPYDEARAIVRRMGLRSAAEWREFAKSGRKSNDIPSTPHYVYADKGWVSWSDWLGTAFEWRSFKEARSFARGLKLKTMRDWKRWSISGKRPKDIPANPKAFYADKGWVSWPDWLGDSHYANRDRYAPFVKARARVRRLGIKSVVEWRKACKSGRISKDIPRWPPHVYGDWSDWYDWLGTA